MEKSNSVGKAFRDKVNRVMKILSLKIILRLLLIKKLSTLLSILVLTIGMASFMLIFFFIHYEKSYDKSWTDAEKIYRIALEKTQANGNITTTATNYSGLCRVIADEVPAVEYATGFQRDIVTAYTTENFIKDANFFWCDTSFFNVFDRPFLCGNQGNPFPTIQSAVISETAAMKLFGRKDPLNGRFKLNEGWEFIVSGTFADIPENSHLKIDILITRKSLSYFVRNFDNSTSTLRTVPVSGPAEPAPSSRGFWGNPNVYTYIRLKKNAGEEMVTRSLPGLSEKYTAHLIANDQKSRFILQPVHSIHLDSHLDGELFMNSDRKTITALYAIAILALAMSWIIFINFQITQSMERSKEFGFRKIAGAGASSLLSQIVLQSIIINSIAIVLAFIILFLLRSRLSDYLQLNSQIPVKSTSLWQFAAVFASGAILSSFYPAWMIISKSAQQLLSERFVHDNYGFNLRRILIVFQFAASIGLMITTAVIIRQVLFMKNKEPGINIGQTVYSYTPMSMIKKEGATQRLTAFMEDINRIPGVISSTVSSCVPGKEINFHSNTIYPSGKPEKQGDNFGILNIDCHFQDVFDPKILSGRMFTREDQPGGPQVLINREACKKLGFGTPESAIGEFVQVRVIDYLNIPETPYLICGVTEDFHQESPRRKIEPLLLIKDYRWKYEVGFVTVRFKNTGHDHEIIARLKEIWGIYFPADPFEFQYTYENYRLQLKADEDLAVLSVIYTILSMLLAAVGLYGLAATLARKRVKEIGIRKVNGAKISEILALLNIEFVKWVTIAFLFAAPLAWYVMHRWLENFAFKTSLSWWIFALSGLMALAISLLTVSWQSWSAATRNPVESLRYE